MPIAQVIDVQQYQGQLMTNRYFYRTAGTINSALLEELLDEFLANVIPEVLPLQHSSVTHTELQASEVGGVSFTTLSINEVGTNGDEPMPSFVALTFQLQRGNKNTRSGSKRIGGVSESWVAGNVIVTDPNIQAAIDGYANILDDALIGTTATWTPVLVKFDPANPGVILAEQIVVGGAFRRISTQNSRKAEV